MKPKDKLDTKSDLAMAISKTHNQSDYIGPKSNQKLFDCIVENNRLQKIYTVVVHRFRVGDSEDPEIYAAEPIWAWQKTDCGKWVMEKALEPPLYHQQIDIGFMGYKYAITAKFKEKDYTYWCLKWADQVDKLTV